VRKACDRPYTEGEEKTEENRDVEEEEDEEIQE
jgi:hypothetical protein